jgi:REP element-mobilizing transposase RayT
VATRVRDLIRDICVQHEVNIMKGHVSQDHVHLFVSIAPQVTISRPAMVEREDRASSDGGISPYQEAVLGQTHVGARIFLL